MLLLNLPVFSCWMSRPISSSRIPRRSALFRLLEPIYALSAGHGGGVGQPKKGGDERSVNFVRCRLFTAPDIL